MKWKRIQKLKIWIAVNTIRVTSEWSVKHCIYPSKDIVLFAYLFTILATSKRDQNHYPFSTISLTQRAHELKTKRFQGSVFGFSQKAKDTTLNHTQLVPCRTMCPKLETRARARASSPNDVRTPKRPRRRRRCRRHRRVSPNRDQQCAVCSTI